ncbi:MAG: metallophosphoesterase [Balneolales bacterium]
MTGKLHLIKTQAAIGPDDVRSAKRSIIAFSLILSLFYIAACQTTSGTDDQVIHNESHQPVKVGLLPDTQGDGSSVSIYPMVAVLEKLQERGVEIVIPVGDLTNHGTTFEFDQWTQVAEKYRNAGMEFLPLMGNHETSHAYSVEWIDKMKDYIPEDAVHMSGAQYNNYYVLRENVLIILLRYYNLPIAFQWIKDVVGTHDGEVDHIVIASHDGLVGAKYGQTREMIVEGTKGDDLLMDQWNEIRSYFSRHDVIWVQGHEHMYQRSVISAPIDVDPISWVPSDGNYRLPQYTQIISGNASYKGYEFRYGERERVQDIIQQKMNTLKNGSEAFDANASILSFDNSQIDYESYFVSHTVENNEEGNKELADPDWILMDQFSRTTDRCERIVYPNSIPETTRPVLYHDVFYRTNDCFAQDGSSARILDGVNNTFNRVESTSESLSWREGYSRAESQMDLARLAYQYLFQDHRPWSPNLNSDRRLVPSDDEQQIEVHRSTFDLKEHVTLSWLPGSEKTMSDILILSGTQIHTGMYINAYGMKKDIEEDTGYERSQPDGSAKQPHLLPESATKSWDIVSAVADPYVLQFVGNSVRPDRVTLAYYEDGGWNAFTREECMINEAYDRAILNQLSNLRGERCKGEHIAGYDSRNGNSWWAILNADVKVALIER